ncbi:MAG TPA: IS630 transposase-related protein [Ottowia sp.]|jgi:transposase|nr:IS630 transposase-related protein [Ottowia sp.]
MAYSEDLKKRVLAFVTAGGSKAEASRRFSVARCTVFVWVGQPADHQRRKPGPKTGHKIDRQRLSQIIEQQPDLLQREIAQMLGVSPNGISRALMAMNISRKKNAAVPAGLHACRRA